MIAAGAAVSGTGSNGADAVDSGAYARAFSEAGGNGGIIKISGVNVRIEGRVTGMMGGWSGVADAAGVGRDPIGGRAIAVAGEGGAGGDVVICAIDSIGILGVVERGAGGWAGARSPWPTTARSATPSAVTRGRAATCGCAVPPPATRRSRSRAGA